MKLFLKQSGLLKELVSALQDSLTSPHSKMYIRTTKQNRHWGGRLKGKQNRDINPYVSQDKSRLLMERSGRKFLYIARLFDACPLQGSLQFSLRHLSWLFWAWGWWLRHSRGLLLQAALIMSVYIIKEGI